MTHQPPTYQSPAGDGDEDAATPPGATAPVTVGEPLRQYTITGRLCAAEWLDESTCDSEQTRPVRKLPLTVYVQSDTADANFNPETTLVCAFGATPTEGGAFFLSATRSVLALADLATHVCPTLCLATDSIALPASPLHVSSAGESLDEPREHNGLHYTKSIYHFPLEFIDPFRPSWTTLLSYDSENAREDTLTIARGGTADTPWYQLQFGHTPNFPRLTFSHPQWTDFIRLLSQYAAMDTPFREAQQTMPKHVAPDGTVTVRGSHHIPAPDMVAPDTPEQPTRAAAPANVL